MSKGVLFATMAVVAVAGIQQPGVAQGLENVASLATMDGKCHKLVIGGADATDLCKPTVLNTAYKSGKTSFMFVAGDKAIVSFLGTDTPARGDKTTVKVEQITLNLMMGTPPTMAPARGTCTYTNPYSGPSLVECSAVASGKTYSATFVSDGREPTVQQF